MTATAIPSVVLQTQSAFLANVSSCIDTTPYLTQSGREEVRALLEGGTGSRVVADALSTVLLEHWAEQTSRTQSGENIVCRRFGAERLFEAFPGVRLYPMKIDRKAFLSEAGSYPEASNRVLEISYSYSYFGDVVSWVQMSCQGMHENMDFYGLHFFHHAADRRVTLRMPTLSLLELGLRHCFREGAARLCEAPGIIDPGQNNQLHQAGFHPYGIPLQRSDIHITPNQHPGILGPHDGYHATFWSASLEPQFREAATLLYDALAQTLQSAEWESFQDICDRLQDLNVSPSILRGALSSLPERLPRVRVVALTDRFAGLIRARFPKPVQRGRDVGDLLRFLAKFRREQLTDIPELQ